MRGVCDKNAHRPIRARRNDRSIRLDPAVQGIERGNKGLSLSSGPNREKPQRARDFALMARAQLLAERVIRGEQTGMVANIGDREQT